MNAEQIKSLLAEHGLRPNKALGQNFLIDDDRLCAIADAAKIEGQAVLEVGPGLGALTQALLLRAKRVVAVEKDAALCAILFNILQDSHLTVVPGDFLHTDVCQLMEFSPFSAVANLPYYVTTPIVEKLLCAYPVSMTLMVQKEAAERFTAQPGDRVYGPVAIVSQYYYEVERIMELSPASYYPQPEVASAVVRFTRRQDRSIPTERLLRLSKTAFSMRRKTLQNNLCGIEGAADALAKADIPGGVRAESLPPEAFAALYTALYGGQL